jgi:hypothetical protein
MLGPPEVAQDGGHADLVNARFHQVLRWQIAFDSLRRI